MIYLIKQIYVGVTKLSDYVFKDFYPSSIEHVCPPNDSVEYSGELFRYTKNNDMVVEKDYNFSLERKKFREKYKNDYDLLCQSGGLSSFLTEEAADLNLEKSKKNAVAMKSFKGLYKVEISESDGVVKHTPSRNNREHHTWWHKKNIDYLSKSCFIKNY